MPPRNWIGDGIQPVIPGLAGTYGHGFLVDLDLQLLVDIGILEVVVVLVVMVFLVLALVVLVVIQMVDMDILAVLVDLL